MSQYAHPEVLVDTQWLTEHLTDPKVQILEVGLSPNVYANAHLPGSVFWNILTDVLLSDLRLNLDPIALEKLMSRSGISNDTTVVAYGSYPGTGAWIFWLLKLLGHPDVRVLNGGHRKWLAEGRLVTAVFADVQPTSYQIHSLNRNLRILQDEVQALIDCQNTILLDVRTLEEYSGKLFLNQPPQDNQRAGHIPGAVHLDHTLTLNEDDTFKSADELQALFNSKGITADREIIPYCAIGGRSGYMWFVLKYLLGYPNVRNYDSSWNEWSRMPNAPIEP